MTHDAELLPRLDAIERENRRLRLLVRAQLGVTILLLAGWLASCVAGPGSGPGASDGPASLTVSELVVVDPSGTPRVRIGGDLPDGQTIDGETVRRGSKAAGVILYDRTGTERGGYVTWDEGDNVGLTLDTQRKQVALFAAGPDGGAVAEIWDGGDRIGFRVDSAGPRLTVLDDGAMVLQRPEVATVPDEACAEYRAATEKLSEDRILDACTSRFPEAACAACLDG